MDKLLTKKDLAEKWQVTETTIDNWRREKVVQPCKGVPVIRFSPDYIAQLEGVKLDKLSPLERKRLETKIQELEEENIALRNIVNKGLNMFTEAAYLMSKE